MPTGRPAAGRVTADALPGGAVPGGRVPGGGVPTGALPAGAPGADVGEATRARQQPAEAKVVAALLFVVAVVATPREQVWAFGVHLLVVVVAARLGRVALPSLARRVALEAPFVLFAALLPVLGGGPRTHFLGLSVSVEGSWAAWNVLSKATLAVAAMALLTATTPVPAILRGMERLRAPRAMVAIAGFMLRYLSVVTGELRRMQVARLSRADDPRWLWQARGVAATSGTLFVRSYERGERVALAMAARGWTGSMPDLCPPTARRFPHGWAVLAFPLAATATALAAWASA